MVDRQTTKTRPILMVDVDGVLVLGRAPEGSHWTADIKRDLGFDKAALQREFFAPYWVDIVTGKDMLLPRLAQALVTLGSKATATEFRDYWFANDALLNAPMLTWLKAKHATGHRIMLATDQEHSRADYLVDMLGPHRICDGIYHSAALGVVKSDPTFFDEIAQVECRDAHDLILIDDTIANIDVARHSGWRAVHFVSQSPETLDAAMH